jgi:hypothetical protein
MGAWGTNSFSNDNVYDLLAIPVIPYRIMGGVDELEVTSNILDDIINDIKKCNNDDVKLGAIVFLVYKGCTIEHEYLDWAIANAKETLEELRNKGEKSSWGKNTDDRIATLEEEVRNLELSKDNGKIDPIHIESISEAGLKNVQKTTNKKTDIEDILFSVNKNNSNTDNKK